MDFCLLLHMSTFLIMCIALNVSPCMCSLQHIHIMAMSVCVRSVVHVLHMCVLALWFFRVCFVILVLFLPLCLHVALSATKISRT